MYMLTNPLFDSLGAAAGLGKAGSFALNQVGQNAQDLALDTIPALNQYLKDGTVSDEEKKALLANIGLNAAGNLVMGGVGLGVDALRAKKAAIPGIEDVDNVVNSATKQAEEAATNIDNLAKQIPELDEDIKLSDSEISNLLSGMEPATKDIPSEAELKELLDEMYESGETAGREEIEALNKEMGNAWADTAKQADEVVEDVTQPISEEMTNKLMYDFSDINDRYYGDGPTIRKSLENKDFAIPDAAVNTTVDKNGKTVYQVVDAKTQRVIKQFTTEKAAEKAKAEYIVGDALKERALKALDDMSGAIHNYEKAAYNSADVEEVNAAKRALEAARKRYERAMKELDPTYYDSLSGKDFADSITQPYYTRNPKAAEPPIDEALLDEITQDWVKTDNENPNRWVRDAEPDSGLVMAEDIGLNPETKFDIEEVPESAAPIRADSTSETLTNDVKERGLSRHINNEDTPMRMEGISDEVANRSAPALCPEVTT